MAQKSARRPSGTKRPPERRRSSGGTWLIAVVVIAIAGLVAARLISPSSSSPKADPNAVLVGKSVPASLMTTIESAARATPKDVTGQGFVSPKTASSPFAVSSTPVLLYMGAEYCPYCAAERWAMVVALSRFGTFTNLHYMLSSATDVHPDTITFTFYGSHYTSPYLTFTPVEMTKRNESQLLQKPTQAEYAYFTANNPSTSIPFFTVGTYYWDGTQVDPTLLKGLTWSTVAGELAHPVAGSAAGDIMENANVLTAAICKSDGMKPANVCQAPEITGLADVLPK